MDCLICFGPVESPIYCSNPLCNVEICSECCQEFVAYSYKNDIMPQCPGMNCKSYYTLDNLKELSIKTVCQYRKACLKHILKEHGTKAQKKIEQQEILENLRRDQKKFIVDTFPQAIALVAEVAMKTKIRRIEKQKAQTISDTLDSANRVCMNSFCNGSLDEDFHCLSCNIRFCKKCEKRLGNNHTCRKEDIESVDFIRAMVHCPHCTFPVEKSTGCNNITCSHCRKNFDYGTGKAGGGGSSNEAIREAVVKRRLSVIYGDHLSKSLQHDLETLEDLEPLPVTLASIMGIISKYYKQKITKKRAILVVSRELNKYLIGIYRHSAYHSTLADIEELLQKNQATKKHLKQAIQLFS